MRVAPTWLAIGVVMAVGTCGSPASARAADPIIPAGREAEVAEIVAPYRLGGEVAADFRLDGIQIGQRRIDFVLATKFETAERVTVALTLRASVGSALVASPPYDLSVDPTDERQSPSARRAIAALKEVVARNADDAFWHRVLRSPPVVGAHASPPHDARVPWALPIALGAPLLVLLLIALGSRAAPRVWGRWAAPLVLAATVVAVPLVAWILTQSSPDGLSDPEASPQYLQGLQRVCARWSLWVALAAGGAAAIATLARGGTKDVRRPRSALAAASVDAVGVLVWSAVVRFGLTEPNILTDGGSGYGRLWRQSVGGWQGLSVLIEALFPEEPRFMWTIIRVPWVLAALAPPLLVLLARALGFRRPAALFAGIALASLPLHAAMYSSDFELGPLLTFDLLGVALAAAAVRFGRAELAAVGAAVLAYTCWGRPDAPIVGAALLVIVAPALHRWQTQPVLMAALGWFAVNAVACVASAHALDLGGHVEPHLPSGFPFRSFLGMQQVVPFWLLLPLPFGVLALLRDPRRLVVVGVGIAAGLVPLCLSHVGDDPTRSYMEYLRYGTWALPWILLVTGEGMEAAVQLFAHRLVRVGPERASHLELAARVTIIAVCMATPLYFQSYLARQYGPRVEEGAFREALRQVPDDCGIVVPDDDSDEQGTGTLEIMRRYVFIAEEAAAEGQSHVKPERIVGATAFLRSAARAEPACWYYFRGSYCYTGWQGRGSAVCAELERDAVLEPVLSQRILYISHRLVTRPDLSDRPLYDPAQSLVLSKIAGWRTDVATTARPH